MEEKRKHQRKELSVKISGVDYIGSENIEALSKDISEGGICITTHKQLPKSRYVNIMFYLPADEKIKAVAEVKWSKIIKPNLYVNGLKFLDIQKSDIQKIRNYIEDHEYEKNNLKEMRKGKRVYLAVEVDFISAEAEAKNISRSGMCISCNQLYQKGRTASIMFFLPTDVCIQAQGEVIWRKEIVPNLYEYGIKFAQIDDEIVNKINKYIQNKDKL